MSSSASSTSSSNDSTGGGQGNAQAPVAPPGDNRGMELLRLAIIVAANDLLQQLDQQQLQQQQQHQHQQQSAAFFSGFPSSSSPVAAPFATQPQALEQLLLASGLANGGGGGGGGQGLLRSSNNNALLNNSPASSPFSASTQDLLHHPAHAHLLGQHLQQAQAHLQTQRQQAPPPPERVQRPTCHENGRSNTTPTQQLPQQQSRLLPQQEPQHRDHSALEQLLLASHLTNSANSGSSTGSALSRLQDRSAPDVAPAPALAPPRPRGITTAVSLDSSSHNSSNTTGGSSRSAPTQEDVASSPLAPRSASLGPASERTSSPQPETRTNTDRSSPPPFCPPNSINNNSFQFPWKLYDMLDHAATQGLDRIVSWQADGTAFCVHQPAEFVNTILPMYFKQTKFKSFQRQLNLYGFVRIGTGPHKGCYAHPKFRRGNREWCQNVTRRQQWRDNTSASASAVAAAAAAATRA